MQTTIPVDAAFRRVLDIHPRALMIVDVQRLLLFRNQAAAQLLAQRLGLFEQDGRLCVSCSAGKVGLRELIAASDAGLNQASNSTRGLRLVTRGREWRLVAQSLAAATGSALVLLEVTEGSAREPVPTRLLGDLFAVTPRESAVAAALIREGSVEAAAASLAIRPDTVRSHAKSLFRKCDVHSRAGLVALLSSLSQFTCGHAVPRAAAP
jgi:DNA-binding CsgD family transcriptional regulator